VIITLKGSSIARSAAGACYAAALSRIGNSILLEIAAMKLLLLSTARSYADYPGTTA